MSFFIFDLCFRSSILKDRALLRTSNNAALLSVYHVYYIGVCSLKKNQSTPRPSEHPPVMGGKCQNV